MESTAHSIAFARNESGSHALHRIFTRLTQEFDGLGKTPSSARFRKVYADWLPEFESLRLEHKARGAIAERGAQLFVDALQLGGESLAEAYARDASPAAELRCIEGNASAALPLSYGEHSAMAIAERLFAEGNCSAEVVDAVRWVSENAASLSLKGKRFVLLGAGAELAPTKHLLAAGADVLWVDVKAPQLERLGPFSGRLFFCETGLDLLSEPKRVRAAVEAFAGDGAHVGCFAYAPGGAREWRLCASMNALVDALDAERVASVSLLLSPASPAAIAGVEAQPPTSIVKLLPKFGGGSVGGVSRNIVPAQGLSYQSAQYLGKRLAAERWRVRLPSSCRVSANMAGISRTSSIAHPLFEAAFAGAHHLGVTIFDASFTSGLCTWLMLRDLFGPEKPPETLLSQQVHGGVLGLQLPLERAISVAALLGLGKHPRLIGRLLTRR